MSRNYFDETCPACGEKNWIDNGHIDDQTRPDTSTFICWKCKSKIVICKGEWGDEHSPHVYGTDPHDEKNDEWCEDGLEVLK